MRAQFIGRVLGTGVRVAGKMAGERLMAAADAPAVRPAGTGAQPQTQTYVNTVDRVRNTGRAVAQAKGGVTRGLGGFFKPFKRVGRVLWLEVTGAFFLLPVVAFAPNLWRIRSNWAHGPDHKMFLISAAVVGVFLYLGISSFWRARRKS
jgi:hypothetical protein